MNIDIDKILLALDTMACALSDHNHEWTLGDRHIYEQVLIELGIKINERNYENNEKM